MLKKIFQLIVLILLVVAGFMCKRDEIISTPGASVSFSKNTLSFDTVFTSFGSATRQFMVYNHNSKSVVISSVRLAGGDNSNFKVNVDGLKGPKIENIELRANDSAYIFVQVFVNPTQQNAPLVIQDSLLFNINGNLQKVQLLAWGQDVHLLNDSVIKTQTWTNDKPYLIYNTVLVDSMQTLTIQPGTIIYLHQKALFVVDGTLICNGTLDSPVIFRGDRLDTSDYSPPLAYNNIPGQWGEIFFRNSSTGNKLNYTTIRSAVNGLQVGEFRNDKGKASAEISNCIVDNCSYAGIIGFNSNIKAYNTLVSNCSYYGFAGVTGGNYDINQCTFVDYSPFGNSERYAVFLSNFIIYNDSTFYGDLTQANFGNCIIYGNFTPELILANNAQHAFNFVFDHCLIKDANKTINVSDNTKFIKNIIGSNDDPGFQSLTNYKWNFRLKRTSTAVGAGNLNVATQYPIDYYGNSRLGILGPDIGAFQHIEPTSK